MKKFLALALALVMALSLAACGKKADDNKGNGDEAKGSVYYLNFKPEADKAWQDLAKTYTEQTGVEVKVVTAASGQYDTMLTSELDKSAPPTMFQVGNQGAVNSYGDFCYPLDNTDVMKEMTTQDFNLKNANGRTADARPAPSIYSPTMGRPAGSASRPRPAMKPSSPTATGSLRGRSRRSTTTLCRAAA